MARTPYKWFNINRIGPGKRVNGNSGKAETTIFWPHYSGKCRTVGTYSPRRNHGRVTASRQTEKTVDTRHWRVDWLRIHSAKGHVTRSNTMQKKDIGVVVCCRQPSSRKAYCWLAGLHWPQHAALVNTNTALTEISLGVVVPRWQWPSCPSELQPQA